MGRFQIKLTAWIAAALLFSALSPAMASLLFAGRPDIQARVLGLPAQHAASEQAGDCPHHATAETHPGDGGSQTHDSPEHTAHGIFCSFCLAASSLAAVPAAPLVYAAPWPGGERFVSNVNQQPPTTNLRLTRHPRDPPPDLVLS